MVLAPPLVALLLATWSPGRAAAASIAAVGAGFTIVESWTPMSYGSWTPSPG